MGLLLYPASYQDMWELALPCNLSNLYPCPCPRVPMSKAVAVREPLTNSPDRGSIDRQLYEDKYYIYVYICALLCIMITQYYTYILMTGWCHLSLYLSVFGILLVDTDDLFTDFEDFDSLLWESPLAGRDREVRVQPLGKALYPGVSRWWDLLVRCYGIHRRITRRNTEVGPAHNVQPFVQADTQKSCGEATLRQNQNFTLIRFSSCSGLFDILQYFTYLSNYTYRPLDRKPR